MLFSCYQTAEVWPPRQSGNNWTIKSFTLIFIQEMNKEFKSCEAQNADRKGKQFYRTGDGELLALDILHYVVIFTWYL